MSQVPIELSPLPTREWVGGNCSIDPNLFFFLLKLREESSRFVRFNYSGHGTYKVMLVSSVGLKSCSRS